MCPQTAEKALGGSGATAPGGYNRRQRQARWRRKALRSKGLSAGFAGRAHRHKQTL